MNLAFSSGQAVIFDVDAHGVYGGFWRDLYKCGPVVIDTVGGDLGIFVSDNFKTGFPFATIVGILSDDPNDDIFGSVYSGSAFGTAVKSLSPIGNRSQLL